MILSQAGQRPPGEGHLFALYLPTEFRAKLCQRSSNPYHSLTMVHSIFMATQ